MKRILSALLCLMLAASAFTGCSENDAVNTKETSADTSISDNPETAPADTEQLGSSIEATDLDGMTVTFITFFDSNSQNSAMDVSADTQTGDVLIDAVYTRNTAIEEKFNIDITSRGDLRHEKLRAEIIKAVLSGDGEMGDILLNSSESQIKCGIEGILLNLNDMPYIDLDKPWWNKQIAEDTEINGVNYFYIGDLNLDSWAQSYVVYFNKVIAENYGIDNIYDTVTNGAWTIDELDRLTRSVYSDINGNGEYDENDLYGLSACSVCIDCFFAASGIKFVGATDDGGLELTITDDFYSTYDKIVSLTQAQEMLYTDRPQYVEKRGVYDRSTFLDNRSLFFIESLGIANSTLRDMEKDFGIVPIPKRSEEQDDYITYSHMDHNSSVALPLTSYNKADTLCMIIEDMAYFSMDTVRPAYYDKVLSGKIARDDNSVAMLEIITQNISYDLGFILLNNHFLSMSGMRAAVTNATPAASYVASNEEMSNKQLETIADAIENNKNK